VRLKHYSHTVYTKKAKRVDLTSTIQSIVHRSGFTNGLVNIFAPYHDCTIVLLPSRGGMPQRDLGVSVTIPFFNSRDPLYRGDTKIYLVDSSSTSTRRKIHLTLIGE
jgi:thiamine phosphate synthase YjbQ (UPF0047 family)